MQLRLPGSLVKMYVAYDDNRGIGMRNVEESAAARVVELSIILVNYNGGAYLSGCLESIKRFCPRNSEVILVDNGSNDDSPRLVERDYPWVRLFCNARNSGFTGGNNLGAEHAKGRYLLLLNTDAFLLEPITAALTWLDQNPEYGILSVAMEDGKGVLQASTGRFPSPTRLVFLRRMLISPHRYVGDKVCPVDWAQGSFLLIRRHLWQELGGLDDRFFMYVEDVDLCKRANDLGAKSGFFPTIRYKHFGGFSAARFPMQVFNLALYVELHMRGARRAASKTVLIFGCLARVLWFGLRDLIARDENSRINRIACLRALRTLIPWPNRLRVREHEVRS